MCPFREVKQDGTKLGEWHSWGDPAGRFGLTASSASGQSAMLFKNGQHCGGFGARQAEVQLTCRLETQLLTVEEHATCQYKLVLGTPAACEEEIAVRLEQEVRAGRRASVEAR